MATLAFSTLLPEVLVHTPGCTEPLALQYLRFAASDFCERTSLWTELQPAVTVDSTSFPYTLVPATTGARVVRVRDVFWDDARLAAFAVSSNYTIATNWRTYTGMPRVFQTTDATVLTVMPLPDAEGSLVVELILAPAWDATGMEDAVLGRYREGIIAGALARLCALPSQPFSNPAAIPMYSGVYAKALHEARIDAGTGYSFADTRVETRPFA